MAKSDAAASGYLEAQDVIFLKIDVQALETYEDGREKAPAAACRKVALAQNHGSIEIWGDGKQTRFLLYIDDCVEGLLRLMESQYRAPLNLGTERPISIDGLVDLACEIAGRQSRKDTI